MLRTGFALQSLLLLIFLSGCTTDQPRHVHIAEAWHQPLRTPITYRVQPGDSLYSIAWLYGLDYRQLAQDNHVAVTYHVRSGKKLLLQPHAVPYEPQSVLQNSPASLKSIGTQPAASPAPVTSQAPMVAKLPSDNLSSKAETLASAPVKAVPNKPVTTTNVAKVSLTNAAATKTNAIVWAWPARGKLTTSNANANLNKGLDISGTLGDPVSAAAAGRVVYAGNGLRGYGLLIIIKHDEDYLSAYAHCQKLLVAEGQQVTRGQKIALLGASEAKNPILHFEIRLNGKPVEPLQYLPAR